MSADTLDQLHVEIEERLFAPGEVVFEDRSPGGDLFIVATGSVRISKVGRNSEQETLAIIGNNDYFGEMSTLEDRPRSAQACALEETEVGVISGSEFRRILAIVPEVSVNFGRLMMQRLSETSEHMIAQLLETERLSLLGRMLSSMVHDFRNPMATILMASHNLKTREDDPVAKRLGTIIESSIDRMNLMTQELLDFSKGVTRIDLQSTTVQDLLVAVEEDVLSALGGNGIEVVRSIGYGGALMVDEGRMSRLLANLAKNAVEAMPDGGRLEIATSLKDNEVFIRFEDTGCGMPDDVAQRIFEPFFTHGKENGTGLGMAIAKSVVDAHRGRIWLETEVGSGSTFHIALPVELT